MRGTQPTVALGIDVGARRLHAVGLDESGAITIAEVVDATETTALDALLDAVRPGSPVAIDGPAGLSAGAYTGDLTIGRKFRTARGCEVELGRQRRIWVPFTTPVAADDAAPWMQAAMAVHQRADERGHLPLETYPYAVFHALGGRRPTKKSTADGSRERIGLLEANGIGHPAMAMWPHDGIDAAGCALVARLHRQGRAAVVRSDLDDTEMWLPEERPTTSSR